MSTRVISLLLSTFSLLLISTFTQANSIPITGSSAAGEEDFSNFVTGPGLLLETSTPSGPLEIETVTPGTLANFQLFVSLCSVLQGCQSATSSVTLGNVTSDMLNGGLIFSGTFTAPTGTAGTEVVVTFPVSMIGNIVAFQDLGNGVQGPELFALNFNGTGTMSVLVCVGCANNGGDIVLSAGGNFTGTASVVPEPNSILLLGSGLAGLVRIRRRQKTKAHSSSDGT